MFVPFWRSPQRSAESPALGKMDIVHRLMDRFGYSRYLEIATSTTGLYHHEIKRGRLAVCRRLLYNLPPDFSDGQPIEYACAGLDISPALAAIAAEGVRFDIMLVDPYHGYEQSYRGSPQYGWNGGWHGRADPSFSNQAALRNAQRTGRCVEDLGYGRYDYCGW